MSWWTNLLKVPPQLSPGESILWVAPVGLTGRTSIAGHLFLTQSRLVFQPNRLAPKSAERRDFPLNNIVKLERVERTGTLYDGGLHPRMRIVLAGGEPPVLLNVPNLDKAVAFLSRVLADRHA
jgi:hypothetical protein